jgi:hypothetical protein
VILPKLVAAITGKDTKVKKVIGVERKLLKMLLTYVND